MNEKSNIKNGQYVGSYSHGIVPGEHSKNSDPSIADESEDVELQIEAAEAIAEVKAEHSGHDLEDEEEEEDEDA